MGNESIESALAMIKNDPSKILALTIGKHKLIPKAEAKGAPELSFSAATGTYLVVGIDLDAPFPFIGIHVLHWIQSGLTSEPTEAGSYKLSTGNSPVIANYIDPAPPLPPPDRYVFLLYEQPEGFNASKFMPAGRKPLGLMKRFGYDLGKFEKEAKLGPIVACNYFNSK